MSEPRPTDESQLIEFIRSIDQPAPEKLHQRVAELTAGAKKPARGLRSPLGLRLGLAGGGGLAAVAVAVAVAVVLAVGGSGGGGSLTFADEMALTLRGATLPAPGENPNARTQLAASVDGVAFPYWEERFGWRSSGARRDRIRGRVVETVFYKSPRGQRVGYAIVAGAPAPTASGGVVRWRQGTPYRLLEQGGLSVVTWLRDGRRCVVSGRGVSTATLLRLASWDDRTTSAA